MTFLQEIAAWIAAAVFGATAFVGGGTGTINQLDQWRATTTPVAAITQAVTGRVLRLTGYNCSGNTNGGTLTTDANGVVTCADDDGGGGGSLSGGVLNALAYWTSSSNVAPTTSPAVGFIVATRTDATSTLPWLDTTRIRVASDFITDLTGSGLSVVSGALTLDRTGDWTGTLDGQDGSFYLSRANHTGTQASSTITGVFNVASGGTGSSTLGGILKGSGTNSVLTAVNGTDFTLVTGTTCSGSDKVSAITASGAVTCSADVSGGGGGLSTSSPWTAGQVAFVQSNSTVSSVATGTLTTTATGLQLSATRNLLGGSAVLSLTSGYEIPLTASTTNWNTFYNTPSTRITAGNQISWSGNTISSTAIGTTSIDTEAEWESIQGGTDYLTVTTNDVTSANLITLISDETGSGNAVFSASPTFTGTALFAGASTTNASTTLATIRKLFDNNGSAGSSGQVLTSNGSTTLWATPAVGDGGITSFNGLTVATQTLATTSANTGWGFGSTGSTHTLNIPTASANVPLGLLSSANWTTFNSKQDALTVGNQITIASNIISATALGTTSIDSSSELRSIVSDETGSGALMFGLTTTMNNDIGCTGLNSIRRNSGNTAWECFTPSSGGGGGGIATTTDNNAEPGEIVSFITSDLYIGGSSSSTAAFNFDKDTTKLTMRAAGASGFIGIATTSSSTVGTNGIVVQGNAFISGYASTTNLSATGTTWINALRDSTGSIGTNGMVLQTNGSAALWVATSSLGISGGSGGITSLNGQAGSTQTFASTSVATGFGITSSGNTHTLNIPTASAGVPLGLLSSSDWTTFNNKQNALTAGNQITIASNVISATALGTTSVDTSAKLRSILTDETGTGALMFGLTTSMANDIGCTGLTSVRRNSGNTAWECFTPSSGGGGGGISTTTDNNAEPGEIVSFITTDLYIGDSASSSAKLNFDKDTTKLTLRAAGTSGFIGIATTSSSTVGTNGIVVQGNSVVTGFSSSTNLSATGTAWLNSVRTNDVGVGTTSPMGYFAIASTSPDYTRPIFVVATSSSFTFRLFTINATTTALMQGADTLNRFNQTGARVLVGGVPFLYNSIGLRDQFYVNGSINSSMRQISCNAGSIIASVTADANSACGGFAFQIGAAVNLVSTTTVLDGNTVRIAGLSTTAGTANISGGLFYGSGSGAIGPINRASSTPVFEWDTYPSSIGSTTVYIGFSNVDNTAANHSAEPSIGCYLTASSTRANWHAICRTSVTAYTMTDTGVPSTTALARGVQWRAEFDNKGFLVFAAATSSNYTQVANITTNLPTTYMNFGFWLGKATAGAASTWAFSRGDLWFRPLYQNLPQY